MQRDLQGGERRLLAELLGPGASRLVEVGCGDGRLSAHLLANASSLVALDTYRPALREAVAAVGGGAKLLLGSGEELPLAGGCADTVVFSLSLHHQEPARALEEARRVLRPGGRVLVLEPVSDTLMTRVFSMLEDERERYQLAEEAVAGSGLVELRSGRVDTVWLFDDFREMAESVFGYFGLQPDREREELMAGLLGGRLRDQPLPVEDATRFWLLAPP